MKKYLWIITYPLCAFGTIAFYEFFRFKLGYTKEEFMLGAILFTCLVMLDYINRIVAVSSKIHYDIKYIYLYVFMILLSFNRDIIDSYSSLFFE